MWKSLRLTGFFFPQGDTSYTARSERRKELPPPPPPPEVQKVTMRQRGRHSQWNDLKKGGGGGSTGWQGDLQLDNWRQNSLEAIKFMRLLILCLCETLSADESRTAETKRQKGLHTPALRPLIPLFVLILFRFCSPCFCIYKHTQIEL